MLKVEKLNKSYTNGVNTYPVLKDVSLHVKKGEFVAVMGPSGSGKTTLLNCISCFIPHDSGKIQLGDMDISSLSERRLARVRNEKLGFVFQDFMGKYLSSTDYCQEACCTDGSKIRKLMQSFWN